MSKGMLLFQFKARLNIFQMLKHATFFACLILIMTGCTMFVKPPTEPVIKQLSGEITGTYTWIDDLNYEGIERAVNESIGYYEDLPFTREFKYGDIIYSPEEMAASLELFLGIIKNFHGDQLIQEIRDRFLIFESRNGDGNAFFTGYYEPLLEGSLYPADDFTEPLYERPDDLVEVNLGQFSEEWKSEVIVGKLEGTRLIPYDSRDEIVYDETLKERARVIAYVKEIELFFLQIQGSGLIQLSDGNVIRVNYAHKNGHPYRAIGKILKDEIPPDKMSLQAIKEYLYANPDKVREILSYNQSYTFFREVGEGPLGNIEVPLTPNRSIAMDRRIIPAGTLAFIETEIPSCEYDEMIEWKPVKRFVMVQDTGGAIRGHGRVDIFFGHGNNAEFSAGHMKRKGRVFILVARKEFLKEESY